MFRATDASNRGCRLGRPAPDPQSEPGRTPPTRYGRSAGAKGWLTRLVPQLLLLACALALFLPGEASAQRWNGPEWRERRTERFAILYADGDEATAEQYASFVDQIYDEVSAIFGHRPAVPVTLRLYPTLERYYEANPLARGLRGIVAHADFRRNEVVVIVPQTDRQTPDEIQNNVRHELAHIIASELSGSRLNVGFQEGVAQYVELPSGELENKIRLLRRALDRGELLPWSDLDSRDLVYGNPDVAYPQALSVVAFLVDRYSFTKLREFLAISARSSGYRSALERAYGVSPAALEEEWRAWLPSYIAGGYLRNALTAYDLSHIEAMLSDGRYAEAQRAVETAIEWLRTTAQTETLLQAEGLLRMAEAGQRADGLAQEARAALEANDYDRALLLAEQALALYADLGDERQDAALRAYIERAQRGQQAAAMLSQAMALAETWQTYPQARATADRAAAEYLALGDRARAEEALALRETLNQRQTLLGGVLLAAGVGGVLLSLFRRVTLREADAW